MKKLDLEVCMCPECVMLGAMDIVESVEALKKLKTQLRLQCQVQITTSNCAQKVKHHNNSPIVRLNGQVIENATSETVMSHIISLTAGNVKK